MTAMPQRIAISHMFGALAATLVGIEEYLRLGGAVPHGTMSALGFEVLFGALTITGSFMAFGKLQELIPGRPITFRGQNAVNLTLFASAIAMFCYLVVRPGNPVLFFVMIGVALLIWRLPMVLPDWWRGYARSWYRCSIPTRDWRRQRRDSRLGTTCSSSVCGALDGGSGFLLSILVSKAIRIGRSGMCCLARSGVRPRLG